jgi:hypothetical protein
VPAIGPAAPERRAGSAAGVGRDWQPAWDGFDDVTELQNNLTESYKFAADEASAPSRHRAHPRAQRADPQADGHAHGSGCELFTGLRRDVGGAEQGAITCI